MTATDAIGLQAYNDAIRSSVPRLVDDLREALGAKLVAYIAGVSETRTVREWTENTRKPSPTAESRLHDVVPTWFREYVDA